MSQGRVVSAVVLLYGTYPTNSVLKRFKSRLPIEFAEPGDEIIPDAPFFRNPGSKAVISLNGQRCISAIWYSKVAIPESNRKERVMRATLSDPPGSYMAATSPSSEFLFDKLDRCCIHSAAGFGDLPPGSSSTTVCRLYFAHGSLDDFLARYAVDTKQLAARQKGASPQRPEIKLEGIAPPRDGRKGRLGLLPGR